MVELKNNIAQASQRATALANATTTISSGYVITKDSQSTIAGNTTASSAIDLAQTTATVMVEVITAMSNNIQNLSSAFQAMDKQLSVQLSRISDEARRFSLND
ncbi:TIGR04197 family type VII secretion effector [Streptococcus fryi]